MSQPPAVCIHDVSFAYPGGESVLFEVNLDVATGELLCLVGPNGGGKTTLLRLIMGDLEPGTGQVRVFGHAPATLRRRLGYVPQHGAFDPRFPVTARDVVLMARARPGCYDRADRVAAEAAMELVDVSDLARRPFADLSGGQRQRVLVARALAVEPDMLLLDEPTANIDPGNAGRLNTALKRLQGRLTCILVSHDMEFVTSLAHRVVCVHREIEIHPTEAFSDAHAEALFGSPVRRVLHQKHLPAASHHHD